VVGRPTVALLFLNDRPEKAQFFKLNVIKSIFIIGNVPDLDEENEMTELRKRMSDARRVFVDSDSTSGSIQPTRCARG
jgi:ABC-type phosphate/phosphonate transport system substrate-binding protein